MSNDSIQNHKPTESNRRDVLRKGVTGALAAVVLGAKGTVLAQNLAEDTPGLTEGPYWVDEMLNRSDVRSDPTSGVVQVGLPLYLAVNVSQLNIDGSISPLPGAFVDIWHCNALGLYSDMAAEGTLGQQFLRGYQVSDAHGNVRFTTVYPGWYSGRTPHIHARVRVYDQATDTVTYNFTTQFFFDEDVTNNVYSNVAPYNSRPIRDTFNATDGIFEGASFDGTPASEAGELLLLRLAANLKRANGSFNIVIDLSNQANEGTGDNPGGGGPPPGGGTPPDGGNPPPDGGGPPPGGGTPPPGGFPPGGGPPTGA
jgi:protocatechuate 3,4-dioxygenase beta subunit